MSSNDLLGPKKFIAVSGNIGTGKTSMVEFLCSNFPIKPILEPNQTNPYLADFYDNMQRWSFHSQIYFLIARFKLHVSLQNESGVVVMDRTIYEDAEVFAKNLYRSRILEKRDYEMYQELYNTLFRSLRPPDIMIYLHCSLRTINKRIRARGRKEEQEIHIDYLRRLNNLYDKWIETYKHGEIIKISTEKFDYIQDMLHQIDLLEKIKHIIQ